MAGGPGWQRSRDRQSRGSPNLWECGQRPGEACLIRVHPGKGLSSRLISGYSHGQGALPGRLLTPVNAGVKRGPNQVENSNSHPSPTCRANVAHRDAELGYRLLGSKSAWDERSNCSNSR